MTGSIRVPLELAQKISSEGIIAGEDLDIEICSWLENYMTVDGIRDKNIGRINSATNFTDAQQMRHWVLPHHRIYEIHEVSNWGTQGPCFPTNVCKVVLYNLEQSRLGKPYITVGKANNIAVALVVAILNAVGGRGEVTHTGGFVSSEHPVGEPTVTNVKLGETPIENFADHPITIGEGNSDGFASSWKPRDALISMLREIDSGRINPIGVVISVLEKHENGQMSDYYRAATPNAVTALGMLELTKKRMDGE